MSVPLLRLYKDESLNREQLEKLNELWELFREDNPKWITRQECMTLKNVENIIFIFYTFDGPAFNHLKDLKAKILGANFMLSSLKNNKKLPKSITPVFSQSMLDLTVCCTNIDKQLREDIYNKVLMMRGKVCKIFTDHVTHLVTNEVGSLKYHAAATMKIPVMLADWVLEVWKDSQNEDIHATDARYLKHRCPIFHKYVICASGFNEAGKAKLKEQIESGGGVYSGDLILGTTTHLIIKEARGAKFEAAKLWKIPMVKIEWVHESIEAGYCLQEKSYLIVPESDNQTSTPTVEDRVRMTGVAASSAAKGGPPSNTGGQKMRPPDIDISCINGAVGGAACVNETEAGLRNTSLSQSLNPGNYSISYSPASVTMRNQPTTTPKVQSKYTDLMKELNSIGKISLTLFDGVGIYFENFDRSINEKLKKLTDMGGAIRFDEYNSDVTHVIVNYVNEKQCKQYIELNPEVNIVSIDWFIDSCKKNHLEECKTYCAFKNALNSVKTPKKRARPESGPPTTNDSDLNDCLSQYLQAEAAVSKPQPTNKTPSLPQPSTFMSRLKQDQQSNQNSNDEFRVPEVPAPDRRQSVNETTLNSSVNGVFAGMNFEIVGFEPDEFEDQKFLLVKNGAKVVTFDPDLSNLVATGSSKRGKAANGDFVLLPMISPAPISNPNQVTVFWMKKCIEKNELQPLSEDIFFQPIPKFNTDKPLSSCVITISGIEQQEKDNISRLCEALGALAQKSLSSKNTGSFKQNTHLICKEPIGPKYEAARNWGIPVVYPEWVIECCVTGVRVEESKFSVENGHNAVSTQLIEILTRIRTNSDDAANSTAASNRDASYNEETCTSIRMQRSGLNDSSLSASKSEPKKPRLEEADLIHQGDETNATKDETQDSTQDEQDTDTDLARAAMDRSNSSLLKRQQLQTPPVAGFATPPCNPRVNELRRTGAFIPPPSNSVGSSPSVPSDNLPPQTGLTCATPVWAKPSNGPSRVGGDLKISSFDYEGAIESLRTPDNVRASRMASGETPDLAVAILAAVEHAKYPNFYAPYDSPIEYGFQKKNKLGSNKEQQNHHRDTRRKEVDKQYEDSESESAGSHIDHYKENIPSGRQSGYNLPDEESSESSEVKEPEIDPKRAFLDQLAATLKQNSNTSANKKLTKNKSDVNKSDSNVTNDPNFSDDTQLMAKFAFAGGPGLEAIENKIDRNKNQQVANNFIDDDDENIPRHSGYRRRGGFGTKDKAVEDPNSKGAKKLGPKNSQFNSNNIMPSQIQVTCWREDLPGANDKPAPHANCKQPVGSRANKNQNPGASRDGNSNVTGRKSKGDGSIAERIVNAARAASTKKN